jgi:MFS superfamily sulfate permease-like transporter
MLASLVPSRGDVFGGISAGIVALPLCLAFGAISGLGPQAGLYGAIAAGILAAIFGGSKVLVTGPTNPLGGVAPTRSSIASRLTRLFDATMPSALTGSPTERVEMTEIISEGIPHCRR